MHHLPPRNLTGHGFRQLASPMTNAGFPSEARIVLATGCEAGRLRCATFALPNCHCAIAPTAGFPRAISDIRNCPGEAAPNSGWKPLDLHSRGAIPKEDSTARQLQPRKPGKK